MVEHQEEDDFEVRKLGRRWEREHRTHLEAETVAEGAIRRSHIAEGQVKEQTASIEHANRELEAFLYAVAHDLRTPLLAVKNIVTWLREDLQDKLTGESVRYMELLIDRVARMDRLLAGLLGYARIGRHDEQIETLSVRTLIDDALHLIMPPSGFEVQIEAEVDALPLIETAPAALAQIFQNLIGNAIKHHDRQEGTIRIAGRELNDEKIEFTVSDDGPGIPAKFHDKVFELFQTLRPMDESRDVGVGLALVKKQIEATGETITIESGDDRGTTFRFTWPKTWPLKKT